MSKRRLIFKDIDTNQKSEKEDSIERRSAEHEKRIYTSIRFDAFANLWVIDLEGTVYRLDEPLKNDAAKKYKDQIIQSADQQMINCILSMTP